MLCTWIRITFPSCQIYRTSFTHSLSLSLVRGSWHCTRWAGDLISAASALIRVLARARILPVEFDIHQFAFKWKKTFIAVRVTCGGISPISFTRYRNLFRRFKKKHKCTITMWRTKKSNIMRILWTRKKEAFLGSSAPLQPHIRGRRKKKEKFVSMSHH